MIQLEIYLHRSANAHRQVSLSDSSTTAPNKSGGARGEFEIIDGEGLQFCGRKEENCSC
jgi:hypothetical protein